MDGLSHKVGAMADPLPDTTGNATRMPVWLRALGILILVAVVIAVVMLPGVLGMGGHGPGLHQPP